MAKWDVEITWQAVATVRIEAATREEAEELAIDGGLPWNEAGEGADGSLTSYTATCVEDDEEPHAATCPSRVNGECLCGVADRNASVCLAGNPTIDGKPCGDPDCVCA